MTQFVHALSLCIQEEEAEEEEYLGEEDEGNGSRESREKGHTNGECDGDELEDLPSYRGRMAGGRWRGPISRKASQTSVYLQEWDIPYEQLELGELIGKVNGYSLTKC